MYFRADNKTQWSFAVLGDPLFVNSEGKVFSKQI